MNRFFSKIFLKLLFLGHCISQNYLWDEFFFVAIQFQLAVEHINSVLNTVRIYRDSIIQKIY